MKKELFLNVLEVRNPNSFLYKIEAWIALQWNKDWFWVEFRLNWMQAHWMEFEFNIVSFFIPNI